MIVRLTMALLWNEHLPLWKPNNLKTATAHLDVAIDDAQAVAVVYCHHHLLEQLPRRRLWDAANLWYWQRIR